MRFALSRSAWPAWVLLAIGLLITGFASLQAKRNIEDTARLQFSFSIDQIVGKIEERIRGYALILRSGAGLFAASNSVTRKEWQSFVDTLRAGDSIPGVQGIGFAQLIQPGQLASHVARIRAEGFPQYTVWPAGQRDIYTSIIYLEPFRDRNLRAFGYDMFSESVRRSAMVRARDSGHAALSDKVTLVQETESDVQAGTLIYFPVYRNGMPTETVEQRQAALIGWVYSPYRMNDLMSGILRDLRQDAGKNLDLRIYDLAEATPESLLYRNLDTAESPPTQAHQRRSLELNGNQWLVTLDRSSASAGIDYSTAWLLLAGGLVISGLLFGLALLMISTRQRAEMLAQQLTLDVRNGEALLRESEARWQFALEGSDLGVWDWNIAQDTVYFSPRWKTMLGYAVDEIGNGLDEWESRIHPEDLPDTLKRVNAYLDGREPTYVCEHRVRCKDGSYKWILDRGMVVERDQTGKPLRMIGTHSDITARKSNEIRLTELLLEAQRLRDALDSVSSFVYMKDGDGHYTYANLPSLKLFGCTATELVGSDDSRFFPPEAVARLQQIDQRVLAGEQTAEEVDISDPLRGRRIYWEVKTPLYAADRKTVVGLCGISTDITESKLLQESLLQSRQDLLEAQRIARVGNWQLDLVTNHVVWSEHLYHMLGFPPDSAPPDFTEQSSLFTPESWARLDAAVALTAKDGTPYDLELQILGKDGASRWMQARGEAIRDAAGAITGLRGVAADITDRKQAELRITRLSRFYAALSECNAAIVHSNTAGELFDKICQIVVRLGGMDLAWIGLTDIATGKIIPAHAYGEKRAYLDNIQVSVRADDPHGRGPTGTAIRENRPVWIEDFPSNAITAPWHERSRQFGWQVSAALPICRDGQPIGALTFYSQESEIFDADIRALLLEMASDISYALDKLAAQAVAEQYQATLIESEQRFRSLVEQSIAGAFIVQDGHLAYVNPRFAKILGYESAADLFGHRPKSITTEKDRDRILKAFRDLVEGRTDAFSEGFTALRRDGSTTEVSVNASRAIYQKRQAVIGLMQDVSDRQVAEEQIRRYARQLERTFMQTVALATSLSEMRDPYTAGHEKRVAEIAVAIGGELGFDQERLQGLKVIGYLHDVGKTAVPSEILAKPGKITPIEYNLIKQHAQAGYDILKEVDFPWPVAQCALQHHERMDGSGYPQGLKGDDIILEARILAVADVVESMASHRPYRPALGIEPALAEIARGRGRSYDPAVVDACLRLFSEKGFTLPA